MTAMGPVTRSQLQHSPKEYAALVETDQPQLLELRTEAGALYLNPSRWERIRLQWAFRHFRVLPPELLSRHDRRLIEKLSQSAIVKPSSPVSRETVFGVIEKAFPTTSKIPGRIRAVETWPESTRAGWTDAGLSGRPLWQRVRDGRAAIRWRSVWAGPGGLSQEWKGLVMLGVVCLAVMLAKVYDLPVPFSAILTGHLQTLAAAPAPVSNGIKTELIPPQTTNAIAAARPATVLPATSGENQLARALLSQKSGLMGSNGSAGDMQGSGLAASTKQAVLETGPPVQSPPLAFSPASTNPAGSPRELAQGIEVPKPTSMAAAPEHPLISEFPQSRFPYPSVSDPNFVGTVTLRAVIGTDGLVKDITVLSGNPKVAQAAVAAVKQWRYAPDEIGGRAIEAETDIGISFFGHDAISVTSGR